MERIDSKNHEFVTLTKKELEVLSATLSFKTYKEIGKHLGMSSETVRSHVKSIRKKWNAPSLACVIALAKEFKVF